MTEKAQCNVMYGKEQMRESTDNTGCHEIIRRGWRQQLCAKNKPATWVTMKVRLIYGRSRIKKAADNMGYYDG
ncbi:MAG TPA: hypothetical protein GXZ32_03750 [Clostridiales bacterium]|nr:hypothetical protein [Clostridiales bacterium]